MKTINCNISIYNTGEKTESMGVVDAPMMEISMMLPHRELPLIMPMAPFNHYADPERDFVGRISRELFKYLRFVSDDNYEQKTKKEGLKIHTNRGSYYQSLKELDRLKIALEVAKRALMLDDREENVAAIEFIDIALSNEFNQHN